MARLVLLALSVLACFTYGDAISCHTCVGQATENDCNENGIIIECAEEFDTCQTSISSTSEGQFITKTCAVSGICSALALDDEPLIPCLGLGSSQASLCYCCCNDSDKCNSGLCEFEEECVPKSYKSSKKSGSKKSGSKKSGSKKSGSKKSGSKKSGSKSKSKKSGSKSKSKKSGSKSVKYCEDSAVALMVSPFLMLLSFLAHKLF